MKKARTPSVEFDPVSAEVWGPETVTKPSGVQKATYSRLFITRIKTPRGLYTSERLNQQVPDSNTTCIIEMSSMGLGANLTSDMYILHRNVRYEIRGRLQQDWRNEMVSYQCVVSNDPV